MNPKQRSKLVMLAEQVWQKDQPKDWSSDAWSPDKNLQELDRWILGVTGSGVSIDEMYDDIRSTCLARIAVAEDKKTKSKKQQSDSIGSVADSIVQSVHPMLETKNFPDDFVRGAKLDLAFVFDRSSLSEIAIEHLLDNYDIEVRAKGGAVAYAGSHPRPVAEGIIRAILLGRSTFSVSTDRAVMDIAVNDFLKWITKAEKEIEGAIRDSAFGTGYEDSLKKEIYLRLGINSLTGATVLPARINL